MKGPRGFPSDSSALIVEVFDDKFRAEPNPAPIFERAILDEWETLLAKMCDFWSSIMLTAGPCKASLAAVRKHIDVLETGRLDQGLALFGDSCDKLLDSEAAGLCWLKAAHLVEA